MSLETLIYSTSSTNAGILAIVGTKIYWSAAEQNISTPFLVIHRIDTFDRRIYHGGTVGGAKSRFQFSCHGSTPTEARSLSRAVRTAFHGYTGTSGGTTVFIAQAMNEVDLVDEDLGHMVALDVVFTHTE